MNTVEYQQSAALTRYPFRDNASLSWIKDLESGTLPNNILLDAMIVCVPSAFGVLTLASISFNTNDQWVFTFVGFDTFEVQVYLLGETGINTYTATNTSETSLLKIDVDVDRLQEYFDTLGFASGTLSFDETSKLCASCVRLISPKVTQVTVYNTTGNSNNTRETVSNLISGDLVLTEGANTTFAASDNYTQNVGVTRGAGAGLYDGCATLDNYVYTINNITPNTYGNLLIGNDACYSAVPGTDGMYLLNQCVSPCLAMDVINDSYYVNRVTDAIIQLQELVNLVKNGSTGFTSMLNDYYTQENDRAGTRNPYIVAQAVTQSNAVNHYHNIVLGLYNSGGQDVKSTVRMTTYGAALSVVPDTTYLASGNSRVRLLDLQITGADTNTLQDVGLPCTSSTNYNVVLRQPVANNDGLSTSNDVLFVISSDDGNYPGQTGGALVALAPDRFNFNVVFRNYISIKDGKRVTTLEIAFMDRLAPPSSNTYLNITYPAYFRMLNSHLVSGDTSTSYAAPGFASAVLDYRVNNTYYLTLDADPSHNTPAAFVIAAGNSHNARTRTINI